MKFVDDDPALSSAEEWVARVDPWLLASDPHQKCVARAIEASSPTVDAYCDCPAPERCTKECCS